jgi:hypothetical protein
MKSIIIPVSNGRASGFLDKNLSFQGNEEPMWSISGLHEVTRVRARSIELKTSTLLQTLQVMFYLLDASKILQLIMSSVWSNPFHFIMFAVGDWGCASKPEKARLGTGKAHIGTRIFRQRFSPFTSTTTPSVSWEMIDLRVAQQLPPKLAQSQ